jgi:hypothetical protein
MPHPDFDPAWLDEDLNVWAERALKADERSRPGSVKRITKRNRYLLNKYLDVIRDHGYAGALEATIAEAEDEGHSDDMVRVALEPWCKAHPQPSERAVEDRLLELAARVETQGRELRGIQDWIGRRNAEAIEGRIKALESALALGNMAAVGGDAHPVEGGQS